MRSYAVKRDIPRGAELMEQVSVHVRVLGAWLLQFKNGTHVMTG